MPYTKSNFHNIIVEEENTQSILRVFRDKERVFSCTVISSGPVTARLIDAKGTFNMDIAKAVAAWMYHKGYIHFTFERGKTKIKQFDVLDWVQPKKKESSV